MEIDTQYAVRMFFPTSTFAQVYFEAVANAFDAGATDIRIEIDTDGQISPARLVVTVVDDGQGFTNDRFAIFRRLQEPHDPYHKGLGRLVYLQYFKSVAVTSVFDGQERTFEFSDSFTGDSHVQPVEPGTPPTTHLRFQKFRKERLHSYDDLRPAAVRHVLIDHFLPILHAKKEEGEDFLISLSLNTDTERSQHEFFSDETTITPADIPDFQQRELTGPELGAFDTIRMSYFIREDGGDGSLLTAVSIDGRAIPLDLIPARPLPLGYSATFLFESEIFQGRSDSARQRLVLPEDLAEDTLYRILRLEVAAVLKNELPEIEERNERTRNHFEERYPHLAGLFDEDAVGIIDKEEALEAAQRRFFLRQKEVLEGDVLDDRVFRRSIELSSRTLAEYVLYRELIIRRLKAMSEDDDETTIHNLVVPRYQRFDGDELMYGIYSNNAWLLDDRFMTFRTVLSEARMQELVEAITLEEDVSGGEGRPDIAMVFSADPSEPEPVDVVVVEVKRRAVDDKEGPYAATQLIKRARKLVEHCPNIQRMWYFGVIEMDDVLEQVLRDMNWTPLFSKGTLYYQDFKVGDVPAPTYLLSFDALIEDAAARNHTFLEILKTDIRAQAAASPAS